MSFVRLVVVVAISFLAGFYFAVRSRFSLCDGDDITFWLDQFWSCKQSFRECTKPRSCSAEVRPHYP